MLFYDCRLYQGEQPRPISRTLRPFTGDDDWFDELATYDYFALRLGVLAFRGWKLKREYFENPNRPPADGDFDPNFEQKGVDMRVGLDIAVLADAKVVKRVLMITSDTDFIPAINHRRKAGLQMGLVMLPGQNGPKQRFPYFDIIRQIEWPTTW